MKSKSPTSQLRQLRAVLRTALRVSLETMGKSLTSLPCVIFAVGLLGLAGCAKPSSRAVVPTDYARYNFGQASVSFEPAFSTQTHILLTQPESGRVVASIYHRKPAEAPSYEEKEWVLERELELSSPQFAVLMEAFESPDFLRATEADYGIVLDGSTLAFRKELGKRVVTVEVTSPWSRAEGIPIVQLAQKFGDAVGLGPDWPTRVPTQK